MKNLSILQFLSIFYDFRLYFDIDAKNKVYKRNLLSRWFLCMKVLFYIIFCNILYYIRNVYSKYPFEILSKSVLKKNCLTADNICIIITNIPLKKVTSEKMPLGVWISHQIHAQMIWWKNQQNPSTKSKVTFYLTANFWSDFAIFKKFSLIFSMGKFITSFFCIFLFRIEFYTKN